MIGKTKFCQGISDINDTYMGFIVDQWGVLHNGEKVFDGVLDCLRELKARKKTILLLSNSGLRASEIKPQLKKMGLLTSLYDGIVTPGEILAQGLASRTTEPFAGLGDRCFLLNTMDDDRLLADSGITVTDDIQTADFLLIGGSAPLFRPLPEYESILKAAVRRGLRFFCMNPDSRALLGTLYVMGPGLLARRYEDFGGVVHYIGKPHPLIFNHCMGIMRESDVYRSHIVMVGDTMAHDILGGWAAGIDTCLVKSGLHAVNFRHATDATETDKALGVLIGLYNNVKPNYLINKFVWGRALPDRKHKIHKKRMPRTRPES